LNETGDVVKATIVPPTSQNQARIEQDLHESLQDYGLDRSDDEIRLFSEKIIRNYDPCISCSTHFLKVDIHRE
jgi:sulfhydrogenase subunit alpha